MKNFMDKDFLLETDTAKKLFHDYANDMPIFDYHCHLEPKEIFEDEPFTDICQIFLGGDHYKWRFMRSNGIDEKYITGDASNYEKFEKYVNCLQYAIGNPLYHWTHLELRRYFGVEEIIKDENCKIIWDKCNKIIQDTKMSPSTLINKSNVKTICTTDDPCDTLEYHIKTKEKKHVNATVLPTFRPDEILTVEGTNFIDYVNKLGNVSKMSIKNLQELKSALKSRIDFFNDNGCMLSDHALSVVTYAFAEEEEIDSIFQKALAKQSLTETEISKYKTNILIFLGSEYASRGWTMQLHLSALRNNNTKMFNKLGANTGFDSIHDKEVAYPLSRILDALEVQDKLPKTILYTLNPKDNYVLGSMLGNFQGTETAGKIQFGSGWWFNDQIDGMREQMKALANLGALSRFVGMLTDSRSFLSYPRHEYFRRILCNIIGTWVENGEFPAEWSILETIVKGICFDNADKYFFSGRN